MSPRDEMPCTKQQLRSASVVGRTLAVGAGAPWNRGKPGYSRVGGSHQTQGYPPGGLSLTILALARHDVVYDLIGEQTSACHMSGARLAGVSYIIFGARVTGAAPELVPLEGGGRKGSMVGGTVADVSRVGD